MRLAHAHLEVWEQVRSKSGIGERFGGNSVITRQSKSGACSRTALFFAVLLTFFLVLCSGGRMAQAQQDVGFIVGNVTDQNGAVVRGAKVHVTNQNNGLAVDVTTDESGNYQVNRLQVGSYAIRITASGFASWTVKNVTVDVMMHVTENAILQVGSEITT
ncbi:MAG: carboxypeptidase-like regulatory domain-containing protein, partial [Terracidiphilus sp.]|nr:carboxypeptidase-like regulatory domain-containing protein [Terracidiphilus sp.]